MATTTITNPQLIKIVNGTSKKLAFVPYRENFNVTIAAGSTVELEASTTGQALYYLKQTNLGLTISQISEFDTASTTITVVDLPATVTLQNATAKPIAFVPYRENFVQSIAAGDSLVIPATTAGQVLYYLEQAALGLTVTQTAAT